MEKEKSKPEKIIFVRYEDIQIYSISEICKIIKFLNWPLNVDKVEEAVEKSRFDNIHNLEKSGKLNNKYFGKVSEEHNLVDNGLRVRKGKMGGFQEYLDNEDIVYITNYINENLNINYGYCGLWKGELNL